MEIAHHSLEFGHFRTRLGIARVARVRREKTDGLVTPIVDQVAIDQIFLVEMRVHRQQLNRGHAQSF